MGLPVILGCDDPDIPRGSPWACFVENSSDGMRQSLPEVDRFLAMWKGRRVSRDDVAHMSVAVKEAQRLAFFDEILQGRRR